MVHLCYCCFYSFNFRSLSCHINKLSKTQHNVLLTIFCVQDYMFQKYVWILVVVVHIIRYVSTCTISRLSTISNVILSLQVYTIINYKINCQNVGAKTDEVDESVSSFSRHWTESLCQITWSKIIAMCKNSFKLSLYNEHLIFPLN